MNQAIKDALDEAVALHKSGKFPAAAHIYNAVLNVEPFNVGVLFLLSDLYLRQEYTGLATNLLTNLLDAAPNHADAWCNLGIAFRKENQYDRAIAAWNRSLEIKGDSVEVCSNMAGLYADRAQPDMALEWVDRALRCDPDNTEAHWLKGLSHLTRREWAKGWPEYEYRMRMEGRDNRDSISVPWWDWSYTDHLYIHGEQGVGDEVMFLSCLDEVIAKVGRVTLEINPKLEAIVRSTWPGINIVTEPVPADYTAKIALGSLASRLRLNGEFPGKPYLHPSPARVAHYQRELEKLGPRPWIALAWLGGTKETRGLDRSLTLDALAPIYKRFTCVSAQYEHTNPYLAHEREANGLVKLDDECIGASIGAQAALFKAVDAVVTVQQTAVHVAGAVGAPTYTMIGQLPHWRYGTSGNDMPWYNSVALYRKTSEDWSEVINRVERDIANQFRVSRAKPAVPRRAA